MEDNMKARQAVLAVVLLGGVSATAVLAQGLGGFEPNQFPAVQGKVAQYSLTPRGDVDGLILDDETEVHLPPHLGAQLVFTVKKPGDQVTVRGLKARDIPTVDAASVTNDATHQTVTDNGPPGPGGPTLQASGQIKAQLHSPRGDLNGVLLQDGTIIHLPPDQAQQIAAQLAVGQPIYVTGEGSVSPLGKVIAAQQIGPNQSQLAQIDNPAQGPGRDRRPQLPPR
jgi:hypothetical protein